MTTEFQITFAGDVLNGLSSVPKTLPSRYFYDEHGDKLFQQIMGLGEYYLTRCESEILHTHKDDLLQLFGANADSFNLVEFGAGDGLKTKILLSHFLEKNSRFAYMPIDISGSVLEQLCIELKQSFPALKVQGIQNEYFSALASLQGGASKKVVLFMGANIGNFDPGQAALFLAQLRAHLQPQDLLVIGFDLKKTPELIAAAYQDGQGITGEFNLNLLRRINQELGGSFDLSKFRHYAFYEPISGEARSFLLSTIAQRVYIRNLNMYFEFDAWEAIHTEISKKYTEAEIAQLARQNGFEVVRNFSDKNGFFVDSVWKVK